MFQVVNDVFGTKYEQSEIIDWDILFNGLPSSYFLDFLIEFEELITEENGWIRLLSCSHVDSDIIKRFNKHVISLEQLFKNENLSEMALRCYCNTFYLDAYYWSIIAKYQRLSASFVKDYYKELYSFKYYLRSESNREVIENEFIQRTLSSIK